MSLDVAKMRKVELINHNGNKNRAVQKLDISRRQVDRLIIMYKEKANLVLPTETEDISPKKH